MRIPVISLAVAVLLMATPLMPAASAEEPVQAGKRLRVVVFGGHPDDPESGAGGLIAALTKQGHEVICAYAR